MRRIAETIGHEKRDIGAEILVGMKEINGLKKGIIQLKVTELSEPSAPQIIRTKLNLSQSSFAGLLGASVRTLQDWEQGRRTPQGPAIALLRIAEQHPEFFCQVALTSSANVIYLKVFHSEVVNSHGIQLNSCFRSRF